MHKLDTIQGYRYIQIIGQIQYEDTGVYKLDTIQGYRYIYRARLDTIRGYRCIYARYNSGLQVCIGQIQYRDTGVYMIYTIQGYRYVQAKYISGLKVCISFIQYRDTDSFLNNLGHISVLFAEIHLITFFGKNSVASGKVHDK